MTDDLAWWDKIHENRDGQMTTSDLTEMFGGLMDMIARGAFPTLNFAFGVANPSLMPVEGMIGLLRYTAFVAKHSDKLPRWRPFLHKVRAELQDRGMSEQRIEDLLRWL